MYICIDVYLHECPPAYAYQLLQHYSSLPAFTPMSKWGGEGLFVRIYFLILYTSPFSYMSVVPIPHCLGYCNYIPE